MAALLLLSLALAADPTPHGADRPPRVRLGGETWDTWGHVRGRFDVISDPPLDEAGFQAGQRQWFSSRFVYGADWRPSPNVAVDIEVEEVSGRFAGDKVDVGLAADPEPFRVPRSDFRDLILTVPRKLSVTLRSERAGLLRVGVQSFSWGLGMLANDGMGDPDFGEPDQGNVNARVLLATQPWRSAEDKPAGVRGLSFFAAGDLVIRDDNAWIYQGDLAAAGIVGLRVQAPRVEVGVLGVGRWQKDRRDPLRPDGTRAVTVAFPVDAYARVTLTPSTWNQRVLLEGEAAVITGHTTRPWLEETRADGAKVLSAGFVGRVRYDHDGARLTAKVEAGFASGDNDPRDATFRTFAFHSDHDVGLILYEQVLPLLTARAADRAVDPELTAVPSPGARFLVQQGQVAGSVYVFPTVRWRPVEPLDLRVGYVGAWTASLSQDPFLTGLGGGYPVGWGGQDAARRHLGHEVDGRMSWRFAGNANLAVELGGEAGLFVPGPALGALGMGVQGNGRLRADITW